MKMEITKVRDLQHRWTELDAKKSSLSSRCREYARWTLPYIFPIDNSDNIEMQHSPDNIGAKAVNHLSNRVVMTLFPSQQVFFRLQIDAETKNMIRELQTRSGATSEQAEVQLQTAINAVEKTLAETEKQANEHLNMVDYRPTAVMAAKNLIITGNVLMFHPKNKPVQAFSLKDYCVERDISGTPVEIMTRETKAFETFIPALQDMLRSPNTPGPKKAYGDKDEVTIYTQIKLEPDGKYHVYQCADFVMLDTENASYPKKKLPWIPLAWNLVHGENYGRGLVEEYAGTFHSLNVMQTSLLSIAAIMGDIKFLVNPASVVNVADLNRSPSGSYHSGKDGDVKVIEFSKLNDAQFIMGMIERYTKQLSEAFLLSDTRQAERVTAEEIRRDAQELEISNGGIYSRLASTWQQPTANIVLDQIEFDGLDDGIEPKVITGMDSLSRSAELDNYRGLLGDLAGLEQVPDDVRARIKISDYIELVCRARQIDSTKVLLSETEFQQKQQQMMAQQQQMVKDEQQGQVEAEAGKQMMKEPE